MIVLPHWKAFSSGKTPQIIPQRSVESVKNKLKIGTSGECRHSRFHNIFRSNHRGISQRKILIFVWTISSCPFLTQRKAGFQPKEEKLSNTRLCVFNWWSSDLVVVVSIMNAETFRHLIRIFFLTLFNNTYPKSWDIRQLFLNLIKRFWYTYAYGLLNRLRIINQKNIYVILMYSICNFVNLLKSENWNCWDIFLSLDHTYMANFLIMLYPISFQISITTISTFQKRYITFLYPKVFKRY